MSMRCYGCMKIKENHPVCEHCGHDARSENSNHQLPAGTIVGQQYLLGKVLGQGGFGITYMGYDQILNQPVAVKEYFPSGYAGRDTLRTLNVTSYDNQSAHSFDSNKQRFLREAESLAKLWNIPQIVRVLRHFEENGTAYIAMEYVEGMDLRKYMKRMGRPLTIEEVMEILGPMIQALALVHKADLVHRDISPDNIMVLPDGSSKLLDFGAARYVENADTERDRNTSTQAILKHGFAPPEQYRSRGALGPWTDIYAMCATVYYCLSGKVPPESMSRMMGEGQLDFENIPGLTLRQKQAVEKGMALMPRDRIKNAEDLYQGLFAEVIAAREAALQAERERKTREEAEKLRLAEERRKEQARQAEQQRRLEEKRKKAAARQNQKDAADNARKEKKGNGTQKKYRGVFAAAAALILLTAAGFVSISGRNAKLQVSDETLAASWEVKETAVPETIPQETSAPEPAVIPLEISSELNLELDEPELGYTQILSVLSSPEGSQIRWSTSDPSVAIVSEDGTVTAVGYGLAQITAACEEQSADCQVYIYRKSNVDLQLGGNASTRKITGTVPWEVIVPGSIDGTIIRRIGPHGFENCYYMGRVVIPDMVEAIEKSAFTHCISLNQVVFPKNLTRIGQFAFADTGLTEVVLPEGVTRLESGVFQWCRQLRTVVLPESLTDIESSVFYHCTGLTEVNIPSKVTSISHSAFMECTNLREIYIPDSVTHLGHSAFSGCTQLQTVHLPAGIWNISNCLFANCRSLKEIVIPDGVSRIYPEAFQGCTSLTSVTIPRSVKIIQASAFENCYNLKSLTIAEDCRVEEGAIPSSCIVTYYES